MLDRQYLYEDSEKPPALFTARVRTGLVGLFFLIVFVRRQPSSISISISSASEIMLQSPSPVRIPLRGLARTPPRQYSKWRCVGNLEDINEFKYRTCLFEDVCYDTISSDFFFAPSCNRSVPFIFDHQRGEQRKFRHRRAGGDEDDVDFVALSKQTKYRAKSSLTWSPLVSHEPVPRYESTTVMLDGSRSPRRRSCRRIWATLLQDEGLPAACRHGAARRVLADTAHPAHARLRNAHRVAQQPRALRQVLGGFSRAAAWRAHGSH